MSAQDGQMLRAALRYAAAGWPVFRCQPGRKIPFERTAGFKDATTDPDVIRSWWAQCPDANIAVPTGDPVGDVLDVDVKPSGSGWAAFNRLNRAGLLTGARALVRTRSAGLHVYFVGTDQPCGRLPAHHLDFKAAGGYVMVPPSFVEADENGPAGTYELLDHRAGTAALDWAQVRALVDPPRPQRPRPQAGTDDVTKLVEWVARRESGDRNHPLYWAAREAATAGALDNAAVERFVDAALRAGLRGGEPEARRTIASAARKAATR
jgi:Bifunctional DNA primase/polymerase, N-terminal